MSALDNCLTPLPILIREGDIHAIRLGEVAIDEFVASLAGPEQKRKGLAELEQAVTPDPSARPSSQVQFAETIVSYVQRKIRALDEDQ